MRSLPVSPGRRLHKVGAGAGGASERPRQRQPAHDCRGPERSCRGARRRSKVPRFAAWPPGCGGSHAGGGAGAHEATRGRNFSPAPENLPARVLHREHGAVRLPGTRESSRRSGATRRGRRPAWVAGTTRRAVGGVRSWPPSASDRRRAASPGRSMPDPQRATSTDAGAPPDLRSSRVTAARGRRSAVARRTAWRRAAVGSPRWTPGGAGRVATRSNAARPRSARGSSLTRARGCGRPRVGVGTAGAPRRPGRARAGPLPAITRPAPTPRPRCTPPGPSTAARARSRTPGPRRARRPRCSAPVRAG